MKTYEELIQDLRDKAEFLRKANRYSNTHNSFAETMSQAANAIDKLVKICNSLLSKYEEEAEAVIWEYSWNIDEDIDELRKEIEDYKAQINSVVEPMEKEHTDV